MRSFFKIFNLISLTFFAANIFSQTPVQPRKIEKVAARKEIFIPQNETDTLGRGSIGALADEDISQRPTASLLYLENSDVLLFDRDYLPDIQLLKGNVRFRHDDIFLYCDSAYFYEGKNSLDAFSNVKIVQGDTLFIYGDVLYYDGNRNLARLRKNVKMENKRAVLTTDSLNYDRILNVGYYFNGGVLKDSLNELKSIFGYYYPNSNVASFKKNVKLTNPNFIMTSDTLHYNTSSRLASIVGPTDIVYEEETHIYSEKGWYDTEQECAKLLDNSYVEHQDTKRLIGDTIFYDKKSGVGHAYKNIELADTLQKVSLFGHYGYYNEISEQGMVTDSAMMTEYSGADTLFLHADTLYMFADSTFKIVEAFHNVRFFRVDMQGVADSMSYQSRDSTLQLMQTPIIWSEEQQISGDTIRAYLKDGAIDKAHIIGSAFACQMKDSLHFNQMSGKEFWAFFADGKISKVEANGNAESIFYPVDESDGEFIGMNRTESSYLHAFFKDGKIDRILLFPSPSGKMYPMLMIPEDQLFHLKFNWQTSFRPLKKEDIFLYFDRKPKTEETMKQKRQRQKSK